ncbi:MAG: hypothetical protein IPJ66_05685 [Bacteroidetes bacterium]|nr:hypothetical protein [Bacteroidota bacterium]
MVPAIFFYNNTSKPIFIASSICKEIPSPLDECYVNACVQGHSIAEVGSDSFTKNFSKVNGGMSYQNPAHNIPPGNSAPLSVECLTPSIITVNTPGFFNL